MYKNFENIILSGYLSKDPETRYFNSGKIKTVFSFPLQDNKESEVLWVNGEAWQDVAEKIAKYKKGDTLIVVGRLRTETYDGKEKTTLKAVAILQGE